MTQLPKRSHLRARDVMHYTYIDTASSRQWTAFQNAPNHVLNMPLQESPRATSGSSPSDSSATCSPQPAVRPNFVDLLRYHHPGKYLHSLMSSCGWPRSSGYDASLLHTAVPRWVPVQGLDGSPSPDTFVMAICKFGMNSMIDPNGNCIDLHTNYD